MLALALALLVSAAPSDVLVNRFAIVQSDDGYLNLRPDPSTAQDPVRQLENGELVLVLTCESERRGGRWCHVISSMPWSGYVYDAELDYEPPEPVEGGRSMTNTSPGTPNVEGAGVAPGFRIIDADVLPTVQSDDGYLNLRAGPGTSHQVLDELLNDHPVQIIGCQSGRRGARWCLVWHPSTYVMGYVYDRELVYPDP
ncbi:MAG: hypothetical protein Rubg2KO_26020 [Rubricoccaceae bacterium]